MRCIWLRLLQYIHWEWNYTLYNKTTRSQSNDKYMFLYTHMKYSIRTIWQCRYTFRIVIEFHLMWFFPHLNAVELGNLLVLRSIKTTCGWRWESLVSEHLFSSGGRSGFVQLLKCHSLKFKYFRRFLKFQNKKI